MPTSWPAAGWTRRSPAAWLTVPPRRLRAGPVRRGACFGSIAAGRGSGQRGRVLEHGLALDERHDDPGVADRTGVRGEDVAVEDREVRELADLDRARLGVEMVDPRRADR